MAAQIAIFEDEYASDKVKPTYRNPSTNMGTTQLWSGLPHNALQSIQIRCSTLVSNEYFYFVDVINTVVSIVDLVSQVDEPCSFKAEGSCTTNMAVVAVGSGDPQR